MDIFNSRFEETIPFRLSLIPLFSGKWSPTGGGPNVEEVRTTLIQQFLLNIYDKLHPERKWNP